MCGTVGFASFQDINKKNWLQKAINTLVRRGPYFIASNGQKIAKLDLLKAIYQL